jgi:hypothetical protein
MSDDIIIIEGGSLTLTPESVPVSMAGVADSRNRRSPAAPGTTVAGRPAPDWRRWNSAASPGGPPSTAPGARPWHRSSR